MKTQQRTSLHHWKRPILVLTLLASFLLAVESSAGPLPLPADLQRKVDRAIDSGVIFLKSGMWPVDQNHLVGYAALPGLTLLECGVPTSDPAVQQAAKFVRMAAPQIDKTYEIALSILFLDKLGEKQKDEPIIQMLALRLIAGQTPTGGWSYKCPILTKDDSKLLLTTLKKLDNPILFNPVTTAQAVNTPPNTANTTAGVGTTPNNSTNPNTSLITAPTTQGSASAGPSTSASTPGLPLKEGQNQAVLKHLVGPPTHLGQSTAAGSRNWAWCIKMDDSAALLAEPIKKKVVIPGKFRGLPVFNMPGFVPLIDPEHKDHEPVWGTTDNSNSQFAVLALWAARRHQVPMFWTLNLVAMRYYSSQNADGSWGYHYRFGGGDPERPPMTCVGLLGLAVAHGLAHDLDTKVLQDQDPWIIKGLAALSKNVGTPTGRDVNLPMANLYFLWSVERVGVLYDLPTIGKKDWYRWGAEILVANQSQDGKWEKSDYWGATPAINTCLALLFLKRANLTTDLASVIPFKADALADEVAKKIDPNMLAIAKQDESKKDTLKKISEPADSPEPEKAKAEPTPMVPVKMTVNEMNNESGSSTGVLWFFGITILIVIGAGVGLVLHARSEQVDEVRPAKRREKKKARR